MEISKSTLGGFLCVQLDELAECIPGRMSALEPEQQALKAALEHFVTGLSREQRQIFLRHCKPQYSHAQSLSKLRCNGH